MAGSLGFVPESVNLCACVLYDGMCCFFPSSSWQL